MDPINYISLKLGEKDKTKKNLLHVGKSKGPHQKQGAKWRITWESAFSTEVAGIPKETRSVTDQQDQCNP